MLSKKPDSKAYIPYGSSYMEFKYSQEKCTVWCQGNSCLQGGGLVIVLFKGSFWGFWSVNTEYMGLFTLWNFKRIDIFALLTANLQLVHFCKCKLHISKFIEEEKVRLF